MKVLIGCPRWGLDHPGIEKMLHTIAKHSEINIIMKKIIKDILLTKKEKK